MTPLGRGQFRLLPAFLLFAGIHATTALAAGVRVSDLPAPATGSTGFSLLAPDRTGVNFTNTLDAWDSATNRVLNNGSGVAAGDFDRDGRIDLFFCSLEGGCRLFRNLGGWRFQDATASAGLRLPPAHYRGAVFADLNGDGWLDLLVGAAGTGVRCLLNDQRGHFADATDAAGLGGTEATETVALADIDGNGTLDAYAANNRTDDIRDWPRVPVIYVNRRPTVPPQLRGRITFENGSLQEFGEPDVLFLNDGHAKFRAVSWTNGAFLDERGQPLAAAPLDWGLTAAFRDLNHDGAPDLYVCNDYWTPDRIWLNDGRGNFRALDNQALRKIPASSMGVDFADINRDGHPDIFAVDMLSRSSEVRRRQTVAKRAAAPRPGDTESRVQTPRNTLLLNRGDGTFAEIACFAGLDASEWSWSPVFLDVDLDGYDDVLVTAGHLRDIQDIDASDRIRAQQESWRRSPTAATNLHLAFVQAKREHSRFYPPLAMPVIAFRNRGDLRFEETTTAWGLGTNGVNHGIALADLDNDGDLDVVVNRLGAPAALFRNNATGPRIAVRLRGRAPNTQAIGARLELLGAAVSNQIHEVTCGGSYMSGHDTQRVFAPGKATNGLGLHVTWRDGSITEMPEVQPNRLYEIDEALAPRAPAVRSSATNSTPLFSDVSALLEHSHYEEPFDDFVRQPLLPRKLSQGGPGAAWFDVNGDGWEDLIVGAGKGGKMAMFLNQSGRGFERVTNQFTANAVTRDQASILGWLRASNQPVLLAASSNYEDGEPDQPGVYVHDLAGGTNLTGLVGQQASAGPMALADLDGDGDLDLFVGGQVVPGQYPVPASSQVFRQDAGRWSLDAENTRKFAGIGLVNSAVWSDLDGDGFPDLVLTCEWGPVRVFENHGGWLVETTSERGLAGFTGLWQSVTTGDFNNDGRPDIAAANWGLNSPWRASPQQPLNVYYGDLAGRGGVDILETEYNDAAARSPVPRHLRDTLAAAIPWLAERFPTHASWSRASVADVLRDRSAKMNQASATTLASMVFLNRGGQFEAGLLPVEPQFSPGFGLCVADFDGDGHEDLFIAQNFFAFRLEESRLDAGRGLLLRGDGRGGFTAMPGQATGLKLPGEQRAAATADYDHDGRSDLVVTQNGAVTALYHNRAARPGLRIWLKGTLANPAAIGATVRLKFGERFGPAREVRAGAGWWSQDSSTLVLATPQAPSALWVRWPGGQTTEHPVAPQATEIRISHDSTR